MPHRQGWCATVHPDMPARYGTCRCSELANQGGTVIDSSATGGGAAKRTTPGHPEPGVQSVGADLGTALAGAQGAFYVASGLWPVVHMRSFEAVTGPKVDRWLVRTVGGLLGVVGAALWSAARSRRLSREIALLGAGTAAVLTAVDITYAGRRRISPVYLLDAAVETALVAAWFVAWPPRHRAS
jgi:hypothetical protein